MKVIAPISLYLSPKQRDGGRSSQYPFFTVIDSIPTRFDEFTVLAIHHDDEYNSDESLTHSPLSDRKGSSKKHV